MKKLTTRWYYTLRELAEKFISTYDPSMVDSVPAIGLGEFCIAIAQENSGYAGGWPAGTTENKKMWAEYLWPEFADASVCFVDKLVDPWELNEEEEPEDEEVWDAIKPILPRFIRWLRESTERYSVLIAAYEGIEDNLMGKVETVSESQGELSQTGTTSNTGSGEDSSTIVVDGSKGHTGTVTTLDLHNDTPQSGGDFTTDPYVSDAHKVTQTNNLTDTDDTTTTNNGTNSSTNHGTSTVSNETSGSTTVGSDVTTPIERLNEVRQKLHNLYVDWAEEFARFVIYAD